MTSNDWYDEPLNFCDVFAGGLLILFALLALPLCFITAFALYYKTNIVTGFRYLLSGLIAAMISLINYSLFPGIIILLKIRTPSSGRRIFQVYHNGLWFASCYHLPLIAWSRLAAVYRPIQYRNEKKTTSYKICLMCYVIGIAQSTIMYFQPWHVTFYYDASAYGFRSDDIQLYLEGGEKFFYMLFDCVIITITFVLYSCTVFQLCKLNRRARNTLSAINGLTVSNNASFPHNPHSLRANNNSTKIETKLISPCICNAAVFIIGQILILSGVSEARWGSWLVLMLFNLTAAMEPVLLLIFSSAINGSNTFGHEQCTDDIN